MEPILAIITASKSSLEQIQLKSIQASFRRAAQPPKIERTEDQMLRQSSILSIIAAKNKMSDGC